MRFIPKGRWRIAVYLGTLIACALGGFWLYLAVFASPINLTNFHKLLAAGSRAEVERILDGPATIVREARPKPGPRAFSQGVFINWDQDAIPVPGWESPKKFPVPAPSLGEFAHRWAGFMVPRMDQSRIAEIHIWDAPDARIAVSFDDEGRVLEGKFQDRITWRYKLARWFPGSK